MQQESNLLSYWGFLIVITVPSPTCVRLINLKLSANILIVFTPVSNLYSSCSVSDFDGVAIKLAIKILLGAGVLFYFRLGYSVTVLAVTLPGHLSLDGNRTRSCLFLLRKANQSIH
jgi:hypothetical protein